MELSSPESEQMVLASMFSNEQAFCYGIENLESIDFTVEDYQIIFISFKTIYKSSNSMAMDKIIVELQEKKMLDKIGGLTALVAIVNVPRLVGFDDFVYYFKIVKNKSTYRKIVATLFNLSNSVKSADGDNPSEFLETCRKELFKINDSQHGELGIDLKKESEEKSAPLLKLKMQDKREGKIVLSAISTGIAGLDKFVGGWGKGQLITIAARTGIGKTALALNSALSLARSGFPIYFFSLEMSYEELRTRIWSQMTRISSEKIKSADLTDEEFVCLQNELSRLNSGCLIINDKTFMKINDVVSKARRCEKQFGISAVFIDYLQLIKSTSATEHRYLEIAEMTRSLKGLAKDLNIPVICLAQLSRKVEERDNHRIHLSDLKESGSIEEDSDVVIALSRRDTYDEYDRPGEALVEILKNRHGPVGKLRLNFDKETMRFNEIER